MIGLKVMMNDPSDLTGGDPWGIVGAQWINDSSNMIHFKLAKQFHTSTLKDVAAYLHKTQNSVLPNFHGMECNRKDDKKSFRVLRQRYKCDFLQQVKTSGNLSEKTRTMGYSMDKNFMVEWLQTKMKDHEIKFPSLPSRDMQEFIEQVPKITRFMTPSGQKSYKAFRGQHDDLFIAGLHCCNIIRLFIDQQERLK